MAVHLRAKSLKRVDLRRDDAATHAPGAHRQAPAAVTVTGNDERLPGQQDAGGTQDAVKRGLSRAVHVVEVPLGLGVVDGDDRVEQLAGTAHRTQPVHARRRFFSAADHPGAVFGMFVVQRENQVGAVVQRQVRIEFKRLFDAPVEFLDRQAAPCVDRKSVIGQGGGDFILRRKRVAAAPGQVGAGGAQRPHQDGRFLRHMEAPGNLEAGKRFRARIFFAKGHHDGHVRLGPVDLHATVGGKADIPDFVVGTAVHIGNLRV